MSAVERLDEIEARAGAARSGRGAVQSHRAAVSSQDVPALVAALRAVLALHQPQRPTSQWDLVSWDACSCGAMAVTTAIDGMRSIGPVAHADCPTVAAITAALDGAS